LGKGAAAVLPGNPHGSASPRRLLRALRAERAPCVWAQPVAKRLHVAAFDIRMSMKFARMAEKLKASGSSLKAPPEGFIVKGRGGPLAEGEVERAKAWAKGLSNS